MKTPKYSPHNERVSKFPWDIKRKNKASLLRSSDIIYSLLSAAYETYSTNKERLIAATEALNEATKEYHRLEESIKEKRETLKNFKLQQKRMKKEKMLFKTKVFEYNQQSLLLQEKETKLRERKKLLKEEFQCDRARVEQLADELAMYLNYKAIQLNDYEISSASENDSQSQDETDSTDIRDLEESVTAHIKSPSGLDPVRRLQCRCIDNNNTRSNVNVQSQTSEKDIQNLACKDSMTTQDGEDGEDLVKSTLNPQNLDDKAPAGSRSGMTVTSESTVSWVHPCCPKLDNTTPDS